jgi:dTDP-glucose 4,6-dehydratase
MTRILVTGAGGFIGSHVAELLVEQGFGVRAFVHYNARGTWGWLEESPHAKELEVVSGDVRDYDAVARAMTGCDAVFHLAALIGIPYSYESPLAYIRTNVEGTYNVLEAARQQALKQVLVTSTSETYGTAQYVPIDEQHPAVGQSPYSATKIAADQLAISYYRSFNLPVKIVRPFNTYGPRQSARAVIPTIITQILAGKRTLQLGNLAPTRDLTFVKDTARGFLEIYRADGLCGAATNIGMNAEISIGDLARLLARLMGVEIASATDSQRVRPDASEVERLWCNHAKIMQQTAWRPAYTLERGLAETIEWLRAYRDLYKPDKYSV